MQGVQVLIAGAGPTGLVLALCLARQGIAVRIIDRNSGPGQASRAMAVQARTLEFYQQLGFADAVVSQGVRMETAHFRENGRELATISLNEIGSGLSPFPFVLCFPQDDHERFLERQLAAAGIKVEWGVALREVEQRGDHVRVVLRQDGTEKLCEAAWLCGCDGAHSTVRQQLDLGFPGGTYEQLFYVADVAVAGPATTDLFGHLGDHSLHLMLPVRSSGMQRLIGLVPAELGTRSDLTFDDVRPVAETMLGVTVTAVNWFSTYRVHHRVASRFRVGRVFIAGDAGHLHSPAGGQGMNTGIGDAVNLSWKLANVIRGRTGPDLLETYNTERIAFARKLVATTDRAFETMTGQTPGRRFVRDWIMPYLAPTLTGIPAVRRAMFRTVSQIRITYRGSALSQGRAGTVHGGDRLPWTGDNYHSLAGMDWRLHVYGNPGPLVTSAAASLGIGVDRFAWTEAVARSGLARDAAYLVRPDGHVALALPEQDPTVLGAYAARIGLNRPNGASPQG